LSPPDNGTAIRVVEFPPLDPAAEAKMDPDFMMKVVGDHAPARGLPVKHPLMHRTRTVDYAVILTGQIDMMLDDTVVHVKAGDVVIQQATNHAWINRGTQPCRILTIAAARAVLDGVGDPNLPAPASQSVSNASHMKVAQKPRGLWLLNQVASRSAPFRLLPS
jgi:mannose-6-phosphate isomerase-like protein (cupin superfamily)